MIKLSKFDYNNFTNELIDYYHYYHNTMSIRFVAEEYLLITNDFNEEKDENDRYIFM